MSEHQTTRAPPLCCARLRLYPAHTCSRIGSARHNGLWFCSSHNPGAAASVFKAIDAALGVNTPNPDPLIAKFAHVEITDDAKP